AKRRAGVNGAVRPLPPTRRGYSRPASAPAGRRAYTSRVQCSPGGRGMKSYTEYLAFNLPARMAFLNITPQVEEIVRKSGVREGLVLVNAMHITAAVFI